MTSCLPPRKDAEHHNKYEQKEHQRDIYLADIYVTPIAVRGVGQRHQTP